jgi:hypothetical protein
VAVIGTGSLKRAAKGVPIGRMLLLGDIAVLAGRHVAALDAAERRRLISLLRRRTTGEGMDDSERKELEALLGKLQPRLFLGTATRRLSPLPLPSRVLFGRRGTAAREAARRGR